MLGRASGALVRAGEGEGKEAGCARVGRKAAPIYVHADGATKEEVADSVRSYMNQNFTHIRVQQGTYGALVKAEPRPPLRPFKHSSDGPTTQDAAFDANKYCQELPKLFKYLREEVGDEVELLHDIHERLSCAQAVQLCRAVEPYHPFFMGPFHNVNKASAIFSVLTSTFTL